MIPNIPKSYNPDLGDIEIAKFIMETIQYDNGTVNRNEQEKFPRHWLIRLAQSAGFFFHNNPVLLDEDVIEDICTGEETEIITKYGYCNGFNEMNDDIAMYFNDL